MDTQYTRVINEDIITLLTQELSLQSWGDILNLYDVNQAYDLFLNKFRALFKARVYSKRTLFYYFTVEHRELKLSEFVSSPHSIAVHFFRIFLVGFPTVCWPSWINFFVSNMSVTTSLR